MAKNLVNRKKKKNRKVNWTGIFAMLVILIFVFFITGGFAWVNGQVISVTASAVINC